MNKKLLKNAMLITIYQINIISNFRNFRITIVAILVDGNRTISAKI